MIHLKLHPVNLEMKHPFGISRGMRTHQHNLIVELQKDGYSGFGEAASNTYYGTTVSGMTQELERWRSCLEQEQLEDADTFWQRWAKRLPATPFLLSALDCAAHDLRAKLAGLTLRESLNIGNARQPITSYTIGLDQPDRMAEKLRETPWPLYKIKLGSPADLSIVELLRSQSTAPFYIDANAGWNLKSALQLLPKLEKLRVELLEQPLPPDNQKGMARLKSISAIPLIADERFNTMEDLEACASGFHGINLKLMKCGGLTPALRIIDAARKLGLQIMVGGMAASSVANTAAAQLLPLVDLADLDGPLLIRNDPAAGLEYHRGKIRIPEGPGLGLHWKGE